jgi:predicted O-methyltransferase YrrM
MNMIHTIDRRELDTRPIDWLGLHKMYLNPGEMEIIAALVHGAEIMIEFGCRDGRTAAVLLHNVPTLERYIGIDVPMTYEPGLPEQKLEMVLHPGEHAFTDPRFDLILYGHGTLDMTAEELPACDAVFIDGDHSERVVANDCELANAIVRPGGIIIWHDYSSHHLSGVTNVLHRLANNGWPIVAVQGTWLAYCRK